MIFGTTIAPGQTTRTTTFARQADNAIFRYETLGGQGSEGLEVRVFTKNSEDTSWGTAAGTFSASSLELTGLKEQVTIEFSMGTESLLVEEPLPNVLEPTNVRVRVHPVQWFNDPVYP